jgi:hypothetical protein
MDCGKGWGWFLIEVVLKLMWSADFINSEDSELSHLIKLSHTTVFHIVDII